MGQLYTPAKQKIKDDLNAWKFIVFYWLFIYLFMGNNHDKYFGSDKRKIIILGLDNSGKTTFLRYVSKEKVDFNTEKTKNLNIEDVKIKDLNVTFFDLAGGERQRVFWKQQYEGTQGIIYMIDASSSNEQKQKSLVELDKVIKQFNSTIPVIIGLTKVDKMQIIEWNKYKIDIRKSLQQKYKDRKVKILEVDYKNKDSIKNLLTELLNETKPI